MFAKYENVQFAGELKLWYCKYYDLKNLVHWHKEAEILFVNEGTMKVGVNSTIFYASAGDLVIINSGNTHFYDTEDRKTSVDILILNEDIIKTILFHFNPALPLLTKEKLKEKNIKVKQTLTRITDELKRKEPFYQEIIQAGIVAFFARCLRCFESGGLSDVMKERARNILESYRQLIDYINRNYADINFQQAAAFMHFSPAHFSKVFKNLAGMTFTEYMNYVRIEKAVSMIRAENMNMIQVAFACGFHTVTHFNRTFKRLTGTVPSQIIKDFAPNNMIFAQGPPDNGFDPSVNHRKIIRVL